jgi:hypothetical protein
MGAARLTNRPFAAVGVQRHYGVGISTGWKKASENRGAT